MKVIPLAFFSFVLGALSFMALAASQKPKEIDLHVEKKEGATRWEPDKVEVHPGEKVKIVAKDELKGPPDAHGLQIPELKIDAVIKYGEPQTFERTVPPDLKPGEYRIACQLHPKHVPATLVVKEKK